MTTCVVKNTGSSSLVVAGQTIPATNGQEDFGAGIMALASDFNLRIALLGGTASLTVNGVQLATSDAISFFKDILAGNLVAPNS